MSKIILENDIKVNKKNSIKKRSVYIYKRKKVFIRIQVILWECSETTILFATVCSFPMKMSFSILFQRPLKLLSFDSSIVPNNIMYHDFPYVINYSWDEILS